MAERRRPLLGHGVITRSGRRTAAGCGALPVDADLPFGVELAELSVVAALLVS